MRVGTSLRFFFHAGRQALEIYQRLAATAEPGAFLERPMGSDDFVEQAANLIEVAAAARKANLWCLLVGDNHAAPAVYGHMFQPVPTIARLSAVTGSMAVGMVLLAPFYHPLLLAEQIGTLGAFVDAPLIVTFAAGNAPQAFAAFGYTLRSRGARTEEMVAVVRALLAGETVTARGRSFEVVNATISPLPRHPTQIWIAGTNEITVERAGQFACRECPLPAPGTAQRTCPRSPHTTGYRVRPLPSVLRNVRQGDRRAAGSGAYWPAPTGL
jgi:alkanesulfonate monooxygenase SsuD/methylene tetrahydromethanopterin reductase-like flavin-dependent oxidoreductase (luciferase family)